jgi:putative MATE family efflux protein
VFLFFAVTAGFSSALRSIGEVRLPIAINVAAMVLNLLLSYLLIFGVLGFPALGVQGAGLGAAIARGLECVALLLVIYRRRAPVAASLGELFHIDFGFAGKVLRPVLPVAINEVLWSLGITSYNAIYGQMGTDSIAAISIAATLDGLAITAFIGVGHATAIMVGHQIGAGNEQEAQHISGRSLLLAAIGGLLMGGIVLLVSQPFLSLYRVSPQVIAHARNILYVIAAFLCLRMMNMILFIGILRSGGDTRFALVLDGFIIWLLGVPLAWAGAFLLHLPVHWVLALTMSEEIAKWGLALWRFFSRKWIHNLAQTVGGG